MGVFCATKINETKEDKIRKEILKVLNMLDYYVENAEYFSLSNEDIIKIERTQDVFCKKLIGLRK
jgi:DUF438 domain-containing protein